MTEQQQLVQEEDLKNLLPIYKDIREMLFNCKFDEVNDKITDMYTRQISAVLLVGMVRLTFMWRKYLANWDSWVAESIKRLDKMGLDGKETMRGLY
jgi:hypothetical protein